MANSLDEAQLLAQLDAQVPLLARAYELNYDGISEDDLGMAPEELKTMGYGRQAGDEKLKVEFKDYALKMEALSLQKRRSVFAPRAIISVQIPTRHGRGNSAEFEIDNSNKTLWISRFPMEWKKYTASKTAKNVDSIDLSSWSILSEVDRANLIGFGLKTIDAVSKISDEKMAEIRDYVAEIEGLRAKAIAYMAYVKADEPQQVVKKR